MTRPLSSPAGTDRRRPGSGPAARAPAAPPPGWLTRLAVTSISGTTDGAVARYTLLAIFFSLLWAAAFIAIKVALRSAPPFFLMVFRFLPAGLLLLTYARLRGKSLPRSVAAWGVVILLGLLNNALYLGLAAVALRGLSAGMASVLASTNPLLLALVAVWILRERLGPWKVSGLLISFGGVVTIMMNRVGDDNRPGAAAVMLLAVAFLVAGTIVFKRLAVRQDLLVVNGGQLLVGGLTLTIPAVLWESVTEVRITPSFLAAQAFLILGVSWLGMLIWFWLLRHGEASRASAYFFLNPVFGLLLAALLLGEPLRPEDLAGSAAVALGIYMVQRG